LPRRGQFIAACAVLIVLAHLVFAQLTLIIAVALFLTGKATRWRPSWLVVPAVAGAVWTLAVGPRAAAAGFAEGPARVLSYLSASGRQAGHLLHPGAAFAGAGRWLPEQLPLAVLTGVAEAALATWLSWLHTDEWNLPKPRPGLLVALRRFALVRMMRAGGIVTRDGVCLGIAPDSAARVTLSWREAAGGVLVCGSVPELRGTSLQLVHAALRRRKPVVAVDLTGDQDMASQFAAACAAAGVPLQVFGGARDAAAGREPACYEPFRHGTAAHRAALVTGMLSWDGPRAQHRRGCAAYLEDVFELLDAAPGDPRVPVLDEVLYLLDPVALRARVRHVPASYPRRRVLTERIMVSARLAEAEPAATTALAAELKALRTSQAGRWLRQPVGGGLASLDLGRTVAARAAALFCLGGPGDPAGRAMLSRLVGQDLLGLGARLRGMGVDGDGIVWLAGCQAIPGPMLADLIAAGPVTGLAVLATTWSAQAAGELAELPNALVVHRVADPGTARRLAAVASTEAPAAVTADDLHSLGDGEFLLAVTRPWRLVPRAFAVRARARDGA